MPPAPAPPPAAPQTGPARRSVTATARITAAPDGRGGTALPVLHGDGPLALRRTRPYEADAHVTLVGAMSAPLGGDRLRLETTVAPSARLHVDSAAATLALPGPGRATYDLCHTVGEGGLLRWCPEPLISAAGSDLAATTRVELAEGARLWLREEYVLGRSGERPGRLAGRLVVHRAGRPLLDQQLTLGDGVPGWDSAAVLGEYRATGQLLVVDPALEGAGRTTELAGGTAALTPLAGPALLLTAVAHDGLELRRTMAALADRLTP